MDDKAPAEALGLPDPGPHQAAEAPPDFVPLKLVLRPSGMVVELTRPDMLFGRHSEADIRLPLPDVSRRHCRFVFEAGAWRVVDLKSLNGVFVNDEPVTHAPVCHGDTIRIGGFTFDAELPVVLREPSPGLKSILGTLPTNSDFRRAC
jgi:pSer/pThr/pTyr-binding forkhead associated (FHA) protein